jgi:thioredoxin 1
MKTESKNKLIYKIVVLVLLIAVVAFSIYLKTSKPAPVPKPTPDSKPEQVVKTPELVELGAGKCMACKAMKPVLEALEKKFSGKLKIKSIDVWEDAEAKDKYQIKMIPTQIFLDSNGKELFRHEGFFAEEDIIKKWAELGINLEK